MTRCGEFLKPDRGRGDGGALLRHGAPQWQLLTFGALTTPIGFWLWHGLVSILVSDLPVAESVTERLSRPRAFSLSWLGWN
jgi:hypothetical protein